MSVQCNLVVLAFISRVTAHCKRAAAAALSRTTSIHPSTHPSIGIAKINFCSKNMKRSECMASALKCEDVQSTGTERIFTWDAPPPTTTVHKQRMEVETVKRHANMKRLMVEVVGPVLDDMVRLVQICTSGKRLKCHRHASK